MKPLYIDIHVLQTVPPSNLNRDDTGSPKTAVFGGTRRARVSSQAWKRAVRDQFNITLDPSQLGSRTKGVVDAVAQKIVALDVGIAAEEAAGLAEAAVGSSGIKFAKRKDGERAETGYLLFVSDLQAQRVAELAVAARPAPPEKKDVKAALDNEHSVDIALFGRMVADSADLNVDASVQVAHAISVHPVETEFDYFTAIDDRRTEEEPGAGMIGTVEFNSSTLYRYATINVAGLHANLGDSEATIQAAIHFIRAFVCSMPGGKQNTFANRTLPDVVVITVSDQQPVNLVGAFEEELLEDGRGRLDVATGALAERAKGIASSYGFEALDSWGVTTSAKTGASLAGWATESTLDGALSSLEERLASAVRVPA